MKVPGGKPGDSVQCPRCSGTVVIVAAEAAQNRTAHAARDASSAGDVRNRLNPSTAGGGSEALVAAIPPADQRTPGRNDPAGQAEIQLAPETVGPQASAWHRNDDLISFDCLICGTRLTAHREEMGHRIACPDCGTMAVVPERRSSSRTRLAGTAQSSVPGKEAHHVEEPLYRLQPPVQRHRPLPHLVDVCEEELFANEPRLVEPRVAEQDGQATPPCSGEVAPSSKSHPPPLISDLEAAEVNAPKTAPPGKAPPGSMPARDHGATREHAGAHLEHAGAYEEAYHVECPLCGTQVLVWPHQVGQQVRCPDCTSTFPVPERVKRPHERTFPTREFPDEIQFLDDWPATNSKAKEYGKSGQVVQSRSQRISPDKNKSKSRKASRANSEGDSNEEDILLPEGGVKRQDHRRAQRAGQSTHGSPSRGGSRVSQVRAHTSAAAASPQHRCPDVDRTCGEADRSTAIQSDVSWEPPERVPRGVSTATNSAMDAAGDGVRGSGSRPSQRPNLQARSKLSLNTANKVARRQPESATAMSDTQRLRRFLETPYILLLMRPLIQPRILLCIVLAAIAGSAIALLMRLEPSGMKVLVPIRILALIIIGMLASLGFYCSTCMSIVEASANGTDRLEGPVMPPVADAVTIAVATVVIFAISCLPGLAVALAVWNFWPEYGFWALVPCLVLSECICLPGVALSQLSSDRTGDFFRPEVFEALLQRKRDWVRYAIVLGLCWAATVSLLLFYEGPWWSTMACVLWVLTSFVHARALGILAAQAILGTHESHGPTRKVAGGTGERKVRSSDER